MWCVQVVLLGLYNGQGLEDEAGGDVRMLSRVLHGPHCPHSQAGTSSGSDGGGSGDGSTGTGTTGGGSTGDGSTGDGVQGPPAEAAAELEGRQGGLGAAHRNKSGGEDTAGGGGGGRPAAEGCSFVRILLLRGKLVGAALIGDTDLEEVGGAGCLYVGGYVCTTVGGPTHISLHSPLCLPIHSSHTLTKHPHHSMLSDLTVNLGLPLTSSCY